MAVDPNLKRWLANYDTARKLKHKGIRQMASIVNNTPTVLNEARKSGLIDDRGYAERLADYQKALTSLSRTPVTRNGIALTKPNGKPLTHIEFVQQGIYKPSGDVENVLESLNLRQQAAKTAMAQAPANPIIEGFKAVPELGSEILSGLGKSIVNTGIKVQALGPTKTIKGVATPTNLFPKDQQVIAPFGIRDPDDMTPAPTEYVPVEDVAKNIQAPETESEAVGSELGAGLVDVAVNPLTMLGLGGVGGVASKRFAKLGIKPVLGSGLVQSMPVVGGIASTLTKDQRYNLFDPLSAGLAWQPDSPLKQRLLEAESVSRQKAPVTRAGVNVVGNVFQAGAFGTKGFLNEGVAALKQGRDAIRNIKANQIAAKATATQVGLPASSAVTQSFKSAVKSTLDAMDTSGQVPSNIGWALYNTVPTVVKAGMAKYKPYDPKTGEGYEAPDAGEWLQVLAGAAILKPAENSIIAKAANAFPELSAQAQSIYTAKKVYNAALDGLYTDLPILKTVQDRTGLSKDEAIAYLNLWFEKNVGRPISSASDITVLQRLTAPKADWDPRSGVTFEDYQKSKFNADAELPFAFDAEGNPTYQQMGKIPPIWDPQLIKQIQSTKRFDTDEQDAAGMPVPNKHDEAMHEILSKSGMGKYSRLTEKNLARDNVKTIMAQMIKATSPSKDDVLDEANRRVQRLQIPEIITEDENGNIRRIGLDPELLFAIDITDVDAEAAVTIDATTSGIKKTSVDVELIPKTIKAFNKQLTWNDVKAGMRYSVKGFDVGGVYVMAQPIGSQDPSTARTVLLGREPLQKILPKSELGTRILQEVESAMTAGGNPLQDRVDAVLLDAAQKRADVRDFPQSVNINGKQFNARYLGQEGDFTWFQLPSGAVIRQIKASRAGAIMRDKPLEPLTGLSSSARIYGWSATLLDQARNTIPDYLDVLLNKKDVTSLVRIHLTDVDQKAIKRLRENYNSELLPEQGKPAPNVEKIRKKYEDRIKAYILSLNKQGSDEPTINYLGMEQPIKVGDVVLIRSYQEGTEMKRVTPLREESKRAVVVSVSENGVGVKLAGRFDDPTSLIHSSLLVPADVQRLSTDDVFNLANLDDEALATAGPFKRQTAEQRKANEEMRAADEARSKERAEQQKANEFLSQIADIDEVFAASSADKLTRVNSAEEASVILRRIQERRRLTPRQYGDIIFTALQNSTLDSHDHIVQAVLSEPATDVTNTSSVIRQNEAINGLRRWLTAGEIGFIADDASEILFSNPVPRTQIQRELTLSDINTVANYALRTWKTGKLETHVANVLKNTRSYAGLAPDVQKPIAERIILRVKQMGSIDVGLSAILQRLPKQNDNAWKYVSKLSTDQQLDLLVRLTESEQFFDPKSEMNQSIETFNTAIKAIAGEPTFKSMPAIKSGSYMDIVRTTVDSRAKVAQRMLVDSANTYSADRDPATIDSQAVKYFVDNLPEAERIQFVNRLLGGLSDGAREQIGTYLTETNKISGDLSLKDLIDFAKANKLRNLTDLQNAADALARGVTAQMASMRSARTDNLDTDTGLASFNEWFDVLEEAPDYFSNTELQEMLLSNRDKYAQELEQNGFGEFMATFIEDLTNVFKSDAMKNESVAALAETARDQAKKTFEMVNANQAKRMSVLEKIDGGTEAVLADNETGLGNERPAPQTRRSDFAEMQEAITKLAEIAVDNVDTKRPPATVSKEDVVAMRKSLRETAQWLRQYGNTNISALDFILPLPGKARGGAAFLEGSIADSARISGDRETWRVGPDGEVVLTKWGATNRVGMAQVFKKTLGLASNASDQARALVSSMAEDLALLWDMNARSYAMRVMDHELQFGNVEAGDFYARVLKAVRDSATNPNDAAIIDQIIDYVKANHTLLEFDGKGNPKSIVKRLFSGINAAFGDNLSEFLQTHRLAQLTNDFYTLNARLLSSGVNPADFTVGSNIRGAEAFIHRVHPISDDVSRNVVNMVLHLNRTSNAGRNAFALAHEVTHGVYHTMPWKQKYELANNALEWAYENYQLKIQGKDGALRRAHKALRDEAAVVKEAKDTMSKSDYELRYEVDIADRDSVTYSDPVINEVVVAYLTNMALSSPQIFAGTDNWAYSATASAAFRSFGNRLGAAIRFMNETLDYGAVDVTRSGVIARWTLGGDSFYGRDDKGRVSHQPLEKGWLIRLAVGDETEMSKYLTPLTESNGQFKTAGSLTKTDRVDISGTRFASIFNRAFGKNYRDVSVQVEELVYAPPSKYQTAVRNVRLVEASPTKITDISNVQNINYSTVEQVVDNGVQFRYRVLEDGKVVTRNIDMNKGNFAYVVSMKDGDKVYKFLLKPEALAGFGTRVSGYSNEAFSKQSSAIIYSLYGGTRKMVDALAGRSAYDEVATAEAMLAATLNSDIVDIDNVLGGKPRAASKGFDPEDFNDPAVEASGVNARQQIYKDGITNELEWGNALIEGLKDAQGADVRPQFIALQNTFNNLRLSLFGGSADGMALSSGENKTNATFYGRKDSNGYLSTPDIYLVGSGKSDVRIGFRQQIAGDLLLLADGLGNGNVANGLALMSKAARESRGIQDFTNKMISLGVDAADLDALLQSRSIDYRKEGVVTSGNRVFKVIDNFAAIKELLQNNLPFGYSETINGPIDGRQIFDYLSRLTESDDTNLANVRNQNIILSHIMKRYIDLGQQTGITSMTDLLTKLQNPLGQDSSVYKDFVSFAQRLNADAAFRARALREWRKYELVDVAQKRGTTPWLIISEVSDANLSPEQRAALATVKKPEGLKPYYAVNPDDGRVVLAERNQVDGSWVFSDRPLSKTGETGTSLFKATAMISDRAGKFGGLSDDERLFGAVSMNKDGEYYPLETYVYLSPQDTTNPHSILPKDFLDPKTNLLVGGSESLTALSAAMKSTQDPNQPDSQIITIALPHRNEYVGGKVDMTSKFRNLNDILSAFKNPVPGELVTLRTLEVLWDSKQDAWRIRDRGIPFTEDVVVNRKLGLGGLLASDQSNAAGISLPEVHIAKILVKKAMNENAPIAEKLRTVTGQERKGANGKVLSKGRTIASKLDDADETWGLTLFSNGFSQRDIEMLRNNPNPDDIGQLVKEAMEPDPDVDFANLLDEDPSMDPDRIEVSVDANGAKNIKAGSNAAKTITKLGRGAQVAANGIGQGLLEIDSLVRIAKLSRDLSAMANQSYLNANWLGDFMSLASGKRPPMMSSVALSIIGMAPNLPSLKQSIANPRHALAQAGDTAFGDKAVHLAIETVLNFVPDLSLEDMQAYGLSLDYLKHFNLFKEALGENPNIRKEDIPLNSRFDDMLGEGHITAVFKKIAPGLSAFERTNVIYKDLAKIMAFQDEYQNVIKVGRPADFVGTQEQFQKRLLKDIAWSVNLLGGNDQGQFSNSDQLNKVQSAFSKLFLSAPYTKSRMVLTPGVGHILLGAKQLVNKGLELSGSNTRINTQTEQRVLMGSPEFSGYANAYIKRKFYTGFASSLVGPLGWRLLKLLAFGKAVATVLEDSDEKPDKFKFIADTATDALSGMMTFEHKGKTYSASMPGALGRMTRQTLRPTKIGEAGIATTMQWYLTQYVENAISPLLSLLKTGISGKDYIGRAAFENSLGYREMRKKALESYGNIPIIGEILRMSPPEMSRFATELVFTINELSQMNSIEDDIDLQRAIMGEELYFIDDKNYESMPALAAANLIGLNLNVTDQYEKAWLDARSDGGTNRSKLKEMRKSAKYRNIIDVLGDSGVSGVLTGFGEGGVNK